VTARGMVLELAPLLTPCPVCGKDPDRIVQQVRPPDPRDPRPWHGTVIDYGMRHHGWEWEPCGHLDTTIVVSLHRTEPPSATWETRDAYNTRMAQPVEEDQ
jgi:hypothetical protein